MDDASCLFCRIAAGQADAEVILDEDDVVAFLDIRPLFPGHVLVVPRQHVDTLEDLPDEAAGAFFTVVRHIATAVRRAMEADGTFVAINNVVSQSVPHLHVHVVPRRRKDGLRGFFWPRHRYAAGQMAEVAEAIRRTLHA